MIAITIQDVNDAPADLALTPAALSENQPAGQVIGTLLPTDEDTSDTFTFALVAGDGDTENAFFTLENGVLTTSAPLDYESTNAPSVRIRVTDAGGLSL